MHTVFGIRHHGPGSARSLAAAFAAAPPDALVIEAPEELGALLPWLDHADLKPPVAALIWATEDSKQASFYPFAVFSPEWVALRWAREHGVPVYCMDLPMRHALALLSATPKPEEAGAAAPADEAKESQTPEDISEGLAETSAGDAQALAGEDPDPTSDQAFDQAPAQANELTTTIDLRDPITALAQAAGYEDGEAWWERLVEARGHSAFEGITEAMAAARDAGIGRLDEDTLRREACMRQTLRTALKAGHSNIAVVCGAYHAPVLTADALKRHAIKDDNGRLKALPKLKVEATWVPWASSKLAYASGYGAGVDAPGWYAHLFEADDPANVASTWLAKIAQSLRAQDIDASVASVIESVRLAQALATMRRRPSPDLAELREASLAVLCHGEALILKLAEERLLGLSPHFDVLGSVPESLPQSPLQADFAAQNRSLRLKTEALEKMLELDLRQTTDRSKSQHFWRLRLIGLDWAQPVDMTRGKGSFRETWRLRWAPEAALLLIEAGRYGGTIAEAARTKVGEALVSATSLALLLTLADEVLKAGLDKDVESVLAALDARAAIASDVSELMAALPPLIALVRYGDVRGTDLASLESLLGSVLTRTCIALPNACAQLNADAATALVKSLDATHAGLQTLADAERLHEWLAALTALAGASTTPPLVAGRSVRLLLDALLLDAEEVSQRMSLALSSGSVPVDAASWLEGFLRGSVHLLLGNAALRQIIGNWLSALGPDDFQSTLPLVRRAFSVFAAAERRLLLQDVLQGNTQSADLNLDDDYEPVAYECVREGLRGWLGP